MHIFFQTLKMENHRRNLKLLCRFCGQKSASVLCTLKSIHLNNKGAFLKKCFVNENTPLLKFCWSCKNKIKEYGKITRKEESTTALNKLVKNLCVFQPHTDDGCKVCDQFPNVSQNEESADESIENVSIYIVGNRAALAVEFKKAYNMIHFLI